MPDEDAEAAVAQLGRRSRELLAARPRSRERRLEQDPAVRGRPVRDGVELRVRGGGDVRRCQLAAAAHLERHAGGVEPPLQALHGAGDLVQVDVADVRRGDHRGRPVAHGELRERDALPQRPRPVVDVRKEVEVQLRAVGAAPGRHRWARARGPAP